VANRNLDKALIQVTEMRQELAQYLPQMSVGYAISSTEQRGLFEFFLLSSLIGGCKSRMFRLVLHYPTLMMTIQKRVRSETRGTFVVT
jgi:hypothetical protein